MKKKILLITPPYHSGVVEVAGRWLPLGLLYIGYALKNNGFDVILYDAMTEGHSLNDIKERIKTVKPDVVGCGAYTSSVNAALDVMGVVKSVNKSIITLLGGVHPSFCYDEIFKGSSADTVDFIIRGEGEETVPELLSALNNGKDITKVKGIAFRKNNKVIVTEERPFIGSLDSIKPAWELVDWSLYTYFMIPGSILAGVSSSRGCIKTCSFCSQKQFWKETWRGRTPEDFVSEIIELNNKYNVNVFLITDEYPTKERERWEEILDRLISENLDIYILMETCVEDIVRDEDILYKYREAGVIHIYVGVEASSQAVLDEFKKDLKVEQSIEAIRLIAENRMISETSFVLGLPDETAGSIRQTLKSAQLYNPDFAHFLCIAPWPYADIYKDLLPYIEVFDYSKYNLVEPVVKPKSMSLKQVFNEVINCYREFYMSKVPEWFKIKDDFKKKYLINSMKAILKNSFLKKYMSGLGKLPDAIKNKKARESKAS